MKKILLSLFALALFTGCTAAPTEQPIKETPIIAAPEDIKLTAYTDNFRLDEEAYHWSFTPEQFNEEDLITYSYTSLNVFEGSEEAAAQILENGKYPGLGLADLHEQGITGEGVNIALIDQPMLIDHPEIAGKVVQYYDTGTNQLEGTGVFHGLAVTSILAGTTTGVAPNVNIYYAAVPSWEADAADHAEALNWIVDENEKLDDEHKIRIVSVSAGPSAPDFENGDQWVKAVARAQSAGIMVIDCRGTAPTGFVFSSYCDPQNKDDITACEFGYPDGRAGSFGQKDNRILAPASYRTFALAYNEGEYIYQYSGVGGQSWAVPYVAGVFALGWQVRPELNAQTMRNLMFESCYVDAEGFQFVDPVAFIEAVKTYQE